MTRDELLIALNTVPADARIMCSDGYNAAASLTYNKATNEVRLVNAHFVRAIKDAGDKSEVKII